VGAADGAPEGAAETVGAADGTAEGAAEPVGAADGAADGTVGGGGEGEGGGGGSGEGEAEGGGKGGYGQYWWSLGHGFWSFPWLRRHTLFMPVFDASCNTFTHRAVDDGVAPSRYRSHPQAAPTPAGRATAG